MTYAPGWSLTGVNSTSAIKNSQENWMVVGPWINYLAGQVQMYDVTGPTPSLSQTLINAEGSPKFSADGNRLFYGDQRFNSVAGVAYIYELVAGTWNPIQTISSPAGSGSYFGLSLACLPSGTLAINADGEDGNLGAVHIYQGPPDGIPGTWSYVEKLVAINRLSPSRFGDQLIFTNDGNYLIIPDYGYNSEQGRFLVFINNGGTFTEVQEIVSPGIVGERFAGCVLNIGNFLYVGANKGGISGLVYIYELVGGTWTYTGITIDPGPAYAGQRFGIYLANNGGRLVISGHAFGIGPGAVFVYDVSGTSTTLLEVIEQALPTNAFFGLATSVGSDNSLYIGGSQPNKAIYQYILEESSSSSSSMSSSTTETSSSSVDDVFFLVSTSLIMNVGNANIQINVSKRSNRIPLLPDGINILNPILEGNLTLRPGGSQRVETHRLNTGMLVSLKRRKAITILESTIPVRTFT